MFYDNFQLQWADFHRDTSKLEWSLGSLPGNLEGRRIVYKIKYNNRVIVSGEFTPSKIWLPLGCHPALCSGIDHVFQLRWENSIRGGDWGGSYVFSYFPKGGAESYRIQCIRCKLIVAHGNLGDI